ncbi:hypothetical protein [Pseudarthrobacter sp. YAF2]|uniref:hypothetical protein n=1 Tax=Pseudarthrobacter sp. YAF2 TaxID=3233078 RepID=UPI003F9D5910
MDRQQAAVTGFRELDANGRPVPPDSAPVDAPAGKRWRAPNPFIALLWVLAAALIAGGSAALLGYPMSMAMADRATFQYLVFAFAPQGVSGGIAVCLALLFWHAWQWQRRRG